MDVGAPVRQDARDTREAREHRGHVRRGGPRAAPRRGRAVSIPLDLSAHEGGPYSQNGEAGVIAKIFEVGGTTNRFCLEFGTGDASECNSRALRENGWTVVMW